MRKITWFLAGLLLLPVFSLPLHADDITPPAAPSALKAAAAKVKAGDFQAALPLLTQAVSEEPNNADALNLMGYSLRKTGKTAEALDYYDRALVVQPNHLGANEYLGELYVELGQPDKAKERLAVLVAACGKNCKQVKMLQSFISKNAGGEHEPY